MDLKLIVADLLEAGWTQVRLAEKAACTQSTISDIARGKSKRGPRYAVAKALLDLHRRSCKRRAA